MTENLPIEREPRRAGRRTRCPMTGSSTRTPPNTDAWRVTVRLDRVLALREPLDDLTPHAV